MFFSLVRRRFVAEIWEKNLSPKTAVGRRINIAANNYDENFLKTPATMFSKNITPSPFLSSQIYLSLKHWKMRLIHNYNYCSFMAWLDNFLYMFLVHKFMLYYVNITLHVWKDYSFNVYDIPLGSDFTNYCININLFVFS